MATEQELYEASRKGVAASELRNEPVFIEIIGAVREKYMRAWQSAQTTDEREACWYKIHALDDLAGEMLRLINQGIQARDIIERHRTK